MNPFYKSPLEQIIQGSYTSRQIEDSKKSEWNAAIDKAIEVVKWKIGDVFPASCREIISKLNSLKK